MSRTQEQLRADFKRQFPDRDWNQACQAVVAHTAEFTVGNVRFYLTAKDAYKASKIVSTKASKAVRNDVHYWAIGTDWHTGVDVGSGMVLMGSPHADGSWGKNLGLISVAAYTAATGAIYKGFSHTNGVNRIAIAVPKPAPQGSAKIRAVGAFLNEQHLGKTTKAATTGIADHTGKKASAYAWLIQAWLIKQGKYPLAKGYKHDGKFARTGGLTRHGEDEIYALIQAAKK
jgi:hypothetical protein